MPELSVFEIEMAIEKLKSLKLPGTDQILAELIIAGGRKIPSWIGRSRSLYLFIRRTIKQIVVITEAYHFCQLRTKYCPTSCCQGKLHMQRKLLGIINVDFDTTGQLLILYSAFVKYLRRNGNRVNQCISCL